MHPAIQLQRPRKLVNNIVLMFRRNALCPHVVDAIHTLLHLYALSVRHACISSCYVYISMSKTTRSCLFTRKLAYSATAFTFVWYHIHFPIEQKKVCQNQTIGWYRYRGKQMHVSKILKLKSMFVCRIYTENFWCSPPRRTKMQNILRFFVEILAKYMRAGPWSVCNVIKWMQWNQECGLITNFKTRPKDTTNMNCK